MQEDWASVRNNAIPDLVVVLKGQQQTPGHVLTFAELAPPWATRPYPAVEVSFGGSLALCNW